MDISALTGATGQKTQAQGKSELGQEDFLKLMVTQMRNQDPFAPMDNGEFLAQMAQFSAASGIGELQKSFEAFQQGMAASQTLSAASLVGREVMVESAQGHLPEEGTLDALIELPRDVGNLTLTVYSRSGERLREISLGRQRAGEVAFSWDGLDAAGKRLPAGGYYLAANTELDGQNYSLATLMASRVGSVTMGGGGHGPVLNLDGLGEVSLADVRQIK